MGSDKAMLTHSSGVSFLEHAASRAIAVCDDVCLSGGGEYESAYRNLEDPIAFQGPITGIVTALATAQRESFDACFITPVDMPRLSADDLRKLKDAWLGAPGRLVCAVSRDDGRIQPLVAIYPTALQQSLIRASRSTDRSLRRWINEIGHDEVPLPSLSCHNINAPEDLTPANDRQRKD